jgi:hypothetical protein
VDVDADGRKAIRRQGFSASRETVAAAGGRSVDVET